MIALVRAELLKLRTVALPYWLLLTALGFVLLSVLATVLTAGLEGAPLQRDDPQLLARAVASAGAGNVIGLVLGILALTQEFSPEPPDPRPAGVRPAGAGRLDPWTST